MGMHSTNLSRATGISSRAWSQHEHERRFPNVLLILTFVQRFGITLG